MGHGKITKSLAGFCKNTCPVCTRAREMGRIGECFTDWGKEVGINVGASWGIKAPEKGCNTIDEILRQADANLYKKKNQKKGVSIPDKAG